jgi:DNA-binding NtrC family response regulator
VKRTPSALLAEVGRLLQTEDESFPGVLQRVLQAVEDAAPPLRVTVTLSGGATLVTGQSEFAPGGHIVSVPLSRGGRQLGALTFEVPAGHSFDEGVTEATQQALALVVGQEVEIRRLGGSPVPVAAGLVGSSGVMQDVFRLVDQAAGSSQTVLLSGEAGVGKARIAETIHRRSVAARGPFVLFSGTALPEAMVEGGLFGHAKGTGGKFDQARGGTLFLEEIADLSLAVQARLATALSPRPDAPRLIASTRRNLETLVAAGRFRADLFERLSVFPIRVPPLRDRGSDIIALADHFVTGFSLQTGKTIKRISTPTLEMLLTYPWPGNVRELETVVERAVLLSDDEVIHGYHLPPSLQSSVHSGTRMHGRLADRLDSLEYEMLVEALKASHGNMTQAARELGLTKRIMGLRMAKFELDYRTFRQGPTDLAEDSDWN